MLDAATDRRPHAVVIGAGFGGLAAAIRLGARGYRVTVLERLDAPGGRASVFRHDGFTFDAGPTIVTAPQLFQELWALCGRRMEDDIRLARMEPFYRIRFDDGSWLDAFSDAEKTRAEVARLSPADVPGFEEFLRTSEAIYRIAYEQLADQPFHRLSTMLRLVPDLLRLSGHRSVHAVVARHFRDPRLRLAFSFHPLLIGGNPFVTSAAYCLITHLERAHGVHYAKGGMGALVAGLVGLIEGQGNRLRCSAEVARILVRDGRAAGVQLADGERIAADLVVSNADPAWTYSTLLAGHPRRRWTDGKLARAKFSMGLFVWYFGTSRRFDDVHHHTMLMGPRYRDLLDDIFRRKVLAEDFSLYLHRPSATDASVAPPGCDAFYALVPVPNLQGGTDWEREAERFRARVEARLEATLLPGLGRAVVVSRVMTPQDFRDRLLSLNGAAFSLEPQLFQSAWFRPHNRSEEVEGLYLVGAGTHPGAGVPGVISSAKVLEKLVPEVSLVR
jgi:phytoene desaturase